VFVIDTNVVSELRKAKARKANRGVEEWARGVSTERLFVSVITVLELEIGILRLERRDRRQGSMLRVWLDRAVLPAFEHRILPIDLHVALRCASLHVPDRQSGRDALIAATALVHGMTIVTRNVGDFSGTGAATLNPFV